MPAIPNFTSQAWQDKRNNVQLTISILDGRGTGMPSFAERVSREQASELAAHVRSFAPVKK
jgi:hypothetical protein